MRINILLFVLLLAIIIYASEDLFNGYISATKLNGKGCNCHRQTADENVNVWIEGPSQLAPSQDRVYKVYLSGGPAVSGGFNVAARYGTLTAIDSNTQKIDVELTHKYPLAFTTDTISWSFEYTAPDSISWDTLYAVANSVNGDAFPDTTDRWNYSQNFPVKIETNVPVELISFTSQVDQNNTVLNWSTATEKNNFGFEVERISGSETSWITIGFVKGNGTTINKNDYLFVDKNLLDGNYQYKLKQLDFNGSYSFSNILNVNIAPSNFSLKQNYPNPFNPSTVIKYSLPSTQNVKLKIYNSVGEEISILVNQSQSAGDYEINWSAQGLPSGIYIYSIEISNGNGLQIFSAQRKMILLK